jgi:hypothetical protein
MTKSAREHPDPTRSSGRPGIFEGEISSLPPKKLACLKCGETEHLTGRATQWEFIRVCMTCGFEWSAGSMNVAIADTSAPPPMPGVPAPPEEDDYGGERYTGAGFRDPDKNY